MREMLEKIDFDALEEIFYAKFARPFGVKTLNFLRPDRISGDIGAPGNPAAYYEALKNYIDMSVANLKYSQSASGDAMPLETRFVEALSHEESHAISHMVCRGWRSWNNRSDSVIARMLFPKAVELETGYQRKRMSQKRSRKVEYSGSELYVLFDEGVTQKMAEEVTESYLTKQGAKPEVVDLYKKQTAEKGPYANTVAVVDRMVKIIASKSGVPESDVWKAIVGGKLHGTEFDNEHAELFAEYFYPNFLADLAGVTPGREILRLFAKVLCLESEVEASDENVEKIVSEIEKEGQSTL